MSEMKLKPCPWCSEIPNEDSFALRDGGYKYGGIVCGCGVQGPDVRTDYREWPAWKPDAIAAWNNRADTRAMGASAVPTAITDWHAAWQAHVDAVATYNARVAFARANEGKNIGTIHCDVEYRLMDEAKRKVFALLPALFDGIGALLAQPDEPKFAHDSPQVYFYRCGWNDAVRAAKSAPNEGGSEPVAWAAVDETGTVVEALGMNQSRRFDTPLFFGLAAPAPAASPAALTDEGAMRVALRIMANLDDRKGVLEGVDDDTKADIADEIAVTILAASQAEKNGESQ